MPARRYLVLAAALLGFALLVFRVVVPRDYRRRGRLTPRTSLLESPVFVLWGVFTWLDLPRGRPPEVHPLLRTGGVLAMGAGIAATVATIAWFGVRRAFGLEVDGLRRTGPYGVTGNPEVLLCGLAVAGYAALRPSWRSAGWVLLCGAAAHLMVLAEEEHLRAVHGEEYARYCARVPRYLGILGGDPGGGRGDGWRRGRRKGSDPTLRPGGGAR